MISSLKIENFKSFTNLEIPQLSPITIIGGRNNVGKSSLLEALLMMIQRSNPFVFLRILKARGIDSLTLNPENIWGPIFQGFDLGNQINFSMTRNNVAEKVSVQFRSILSDISAFPDKKPNDSQDLVIRTDQTPVTSYFLDYTYQMDDNPTLSYSFIIEEGRMGARGHRDAFRTSIPIGVLYSRIHEDTNELAKKFGKLDVVGETDVLIGFLKKIEPDLKSLSTITIGDTSIIHADIGTGRKIPINYMGEGMSRLLSIIVEIAVQKRGYVLIDEIENGLHHSVLPQVWEGIARAAEHYECQVIATTHSYECLQAAHEGLSSAGLSNHLSYIRLDRIQNEVKAKTFTDQGLAFALNKNWEVR